MKKITVEIEFDKYTPFGRTHCEAHLPIFEEDFGTEATAEKVVDYVKKVFNNPHHIEPMATFAYRDIDNENPRQKHFTGRFFSIGLCCNIDKVVWDDHGETKERTYVSKVTKKDIVAMLNDCIARANDTVYSFKEVI